MPAFCNPNPNRALPATYRAVPSPLSKLTWWSALVACHSIRNPTQAPLSHQHWAALHQNPLLFIAHTDASQSYPGTFGGARTQDCNWNLQCRGWTEKLTVPCVPLWYSAAHPTLCCGNRQTTSCLLFLSVIQETMALSTCIALSKRQKTENIQCRIS